MRSLSHRAVIPSFLTGVLTLSCASAQSPPTSERPKFFVWNEGIPCGVVPTSSDFLVAMPKLFLGPDDEPEDGAIAANAVADYVFRHTRSSSSYPWLPLNNPLDTNCHSVGSPHAPDLYSTADHPDFNNICVSIQNFGAETWAQVASQDDWFSSPLRFFTEADRLVDYEWLAQNPGGTPSNTDNEFGFPVNRQIPDPIPQNWSPGTFVNRTYRHPFLWNAGFKESTRGTPPLKAWMQAFVLQYKARHQADPSIPIPQRWYLDTEPFITWAGSLNELVGANKESADCVRILEQIYASRSSTDPLYPNYWSGVGVPGDPGDPSQGCSPGQCTLRQIYLRDRIKFNLPVYEAGHPNAGEPDFRMFTSNLGTPQNPIPAPGSHLRNRAIMLWWAEVCQRAADQVMKNCLYDVIHDAGTEWSTAKVGNYSTTKQDGQLHDVGAAFDSTCLYTPPSGSNPGDDSCWQADRFSRATYNGAPAGSTVTVGQLPAATRFPDVDGAGNFHIYPLEAGGIWQSERRWGSVVQTAFGSVDQPVVYPLSVGTSWQVVMQRNPYARVLWDGNLWELREQAGMRIMRAELETSAGARSQIPGDRQVVPWVFMAGTKYADEAYFRFSRYEHAQHFALLRSKKVTEAIVWTNLKYNGATSADAWNETEEVIKEVYAPRLAAMTYSGTGGSEVNTNAPGDLDKLNDTLLSTAGQPKTINVYANPSPGSPGRMVLKYHNYYDPANPSDNFTTMVNNGYDFMILVECRAYTGHGGGTVPYLDGSIKVACKQVDGQLMKLSSFDSETSVSTGRNPLGVTRCFWFAPNSALEQPNSRLDPSSIVIDAENTTGAPFRLEVDLVQVIPYKVTGAHLLSTVCNPAFVDAENSAENPAFVLNTLFADGSASGGAKFVWDQPIYPEHFGDQVTDKLLRVYVCTGDDTNPLADVTCRTVQTLEDNGQTVRVRYRANGSSTFTPMPMGLYKFCTFTCATNLTNGCPNLPYPRLRTDTVSATEFNPPAKTQTVWVEVGAIDPPPPPPSPDCPADVDDGSGSGMPDGGVTIDDLLYYLVAFEAGIPNADVDDGSFTGMLDGGVTIDDLLYFLYRFEAGC